jgi:hypothetical protein
MRARLFFNAEFISRLNESHTLMPFIVTQFEATPNPNAVKCWLDHPISEGPRSFFNAKMAAADPIATALFNQAGVTNVLFNGDWMTVNKPAETDWKSIKAKVKAVLKDLP